MNPLDIAHPRRRTRLRFAFAILGACAANLSAAPAGETSLHAERAWVRLVPPSAQVTAGFAVLRNDGDRPLSVVGASSDASSTVELHVMSDVAGQMTMRRVDRFEVSAHGTLVLAPGGAHLMLIGLARPLAEGAEVRLELQLDGGETMAIAMPVRRAAPEDDSR